MAFPILFLIFLVTIIIVYGFLTVYFREVSLAKNPDGTSTTLENPVKGVRNICLLIMDTLFTLLGFGLLLSPFKHQKWAGMSIALFVVAFNIILGLLIQDFWFEVFFGFRKNLDSGDNGLVVAPNAYEFWLRHSTTGKSTASFFSFRLSNLCSTSYLVGMTAFSGRVTFTNIAFSLPFFCILYYLNLYLNMLACYSIENKDASFAYFDTYGTIIIYLFGGVYGIIVGALTKTPPIETADDIERSRKSRMSLHLSLLGSFFIFATFILSYTGLLSLSNSAYRYFRFNSAAILVTFGLAGGILGNYVVSILTGKGRANLNSIIIGTFTGGIMVGGLADVIENIGACIFIGFLAGGFAGLFGTLVTPSMNKKGIVDSQGMLGPILIVSILACFVVHPSVLHQFFIRNSTLVPRGTGYAEPDYRPARYHLVYFGITLGIAAVTGLIMGLIYRIKRTSLRDFEDAKFFVDDYGLYNNDEGTHSYLPAPATATNLPH